MTCYLAQNENEFSLEFSLLTDLNLLSYTAGFMLESLVVYNIPCIKYPSLNFDPPSVREEVFKEPLLLIDSLPYGDMHPLEWYYNTSLVCIGVAKPGYHHHCPRISKL